MKKEKSLNFIFLIMAIIIGVALIKQFDFEKLRFEKTGLAIVYMIGFAISVFVLIKDYRAK